MTPQLSATVGVRLKEAREKRGISLRRLADRTRISVMALEALERNDIKRLPGGIFTRAFLRAYAAEVGLDPEQTVRDFLGQFPQDSAASGGRPIDDNDAIESDRRMAGTVARLALVSIPLAAAILYFGVRPSPVARPEQTAQPAAVAPTSSESQTSPDTEGTALTVAASPPLSVVISPRSDCWVSVVADGANVASGLLTTGQRREVRASREIVLTVGDAEACTYTVNGMAGRPLGGRGEAATRRISRENYRTFVLPR